MNLARILLTLCLWPTPAGAHIDEWRWGDGKGARPSIPPALHRPAMPASVLAPGQGRSGAHLDLARSFDSGRTNVYPYDADNAFTAFGFGTRWGLAPGGVELGASLDYPFFLPALFVRYRPFAWGGAFGPFWSLEAGATFMPDYHGGGALGFKLGPQLELWGAYRGGRVLDRGYSELSGGATLAAATTMDISGGYAWRRYDTEPYEQTTRVSLRLEFGNSAHPLGGERKNGGRSAEELLEAGDYKAAAQAYADELEVYPKDAARWRAYATALEELGMHRKARKARLKALKAEAEQEKNGRLSEKDAIKS